MLAEDLHSKGVRVPVGSTGVIQDRMFGVIVWYTRCEASQMDAERSGWPLYGSLFSKEDEKILFHIKSHGCNAYATIHFRSARWFGRINAWKFLEDQFVRVLFVRGLSISSDEYPRGKLIGRSSRMVNGEDFASRPGKVAPAELLLAKGFEPLEQGDGSGEFVEGGVSQLDPVPQDKVVADQRLETLTDLRMEALDMLRTTDKTVRIPVCKGEGLQVLKTKER